MTKPDATQVLVFAKAPVAGAVKTRLIPRLGAEGAARLYEHLVCRALRQTVEAGVGPVTLYCAPDTSHPFFASCQEACNVTLRNQVGADLGTRMHAALAQALLTHRQALLIGSDCPMLDAGRLRAAVATLTTGSDLVFAPAEDGGYALIGARKIDAEVFRGIEWGGATVMQQTRERVAGLGWRWHELPEVWDVDRPQDLDRLPSLQMTDIA